MELAHEDLEKLIKSGATIASESFSEIFEASMAPISPDNTCTANTIQSQEQLVSTQTDQTAEQSASSDDS